MDHKNSRPVFLEALPYLALALMVVIFFLPLWSQGKMFCFRDIPGYFYPAKHYGALALESGTLPLWNPLLFNGTPFFAALQTQVLEPAGMITDFLPLPQSFNLYTVFLFFLGGCFMILLLRDWPASRTAALVGGVTFTFGGYLVSVLNLTTTLAAVVWLPLLLFLFKRLLGPRPRVFLVPTAIALTLVILGGEPTVAVTAFFILFTFILFRPLNAPRPLCQRGDAFLRLALLLGLSFLLAAVQLLPFLELVAHTARATGTQPFDALAWSLFPSHLVNLFFPITYGKLVYPGEYVGAQLFQFLVSGFYLGVFPAVLAFLSLLRKEKRETAWLWFLLLTGLFLSMGRFTPVYTWLYQNFPLVSFIRYPPKYMMLTHFAACILAGLGWNAVVGLEREKKKRLLQAGLGVLLLAALAFAVMALGERHWVALLIKGKKMAFSQIYNLINVYRFILETYWRVVLLLGGILLVLFLAGRRSPVRWVVPTLLACLIFLDLYQVNHQAYPVSVPSFFTEKPQYLKLLKEPGRVYVSRQAELKSLYLPMRVFDDSLLLIKEWFAVDLTQVFFVPMVNGYDPLERADYTRFREVLETDLTGSRLLDAAGARYVVTAHPLPEGRRFKLLKSGFLYLYENRNALPEAWAVGKAISNWDTLGNISGPAFDPGREVILSNYVLLENGSAWAAPGKVDIVEKVPERVVLRTALKAHGFVVLSDSFYPGWKAWVDGKETRVLRANGVFRAVAVPAGKHVIKFVFEPLSFKLGLLVSLLTLILCLWLGVKKAFA